MSTDLQDPPATPETLGDQAFQGYPDRKDTEGCQADQVFVVSKAGVETRETQDPQVPQALSDRWAPLEPQVNVGRTAPQGPPDFQELTAKMASVGCLVISDHPDPLASREHLDLKETLASPVPVD